MSSRTIDSTTHTMYWYKYWRTVVFVDERTAKHRRDVLDVMGTKNEMSRTYSSYKSYKYFTQEHILLAWQSEL